MVVVARTTFARERPDAALAREWADLVEQTRAVPFSMPGWVTAWAESRAVGITALTARRDGELVGLLPTVVARRRISLPADWHTPVVEAVAADPGALACLGEGLVSEAPSAIHLDFVDRDGDTARFLSETLTRAGYRLRMRTAMTSPFITLDGDADAYLEGLGTRKRSELRRRRRRLEEAGDVVFEVHDGTERLDTLLDEGFRIESAGWKGKAGSAITSDPSVEALYRSAARWAAPLGMLRLGFLRLDGRAIAFDYCFEASGFHYLLKTGFDPEAKRFAPAVQLRAFMIRRAFDVGLNRYEFAGNADPWKLEWTDETREIVRIDAYRPGVRGGISGSIDRMRRKVRRSANGAGR